MKWLLAEAELRTQFAIVVGVNVAGLLALGTWTYTSAPPRASFVAASTGRVADRSTTSRGQEVFHPRGLMSWGSF